MNQINWKIESVDIEKLKPYEKNPRKITKKEFEKLKDRISRLGFYAALKVDIDYTVIGGNQRFKALKSLGYKEINCFIPDRKLTDEELKEILISDNTHSGEWDINSLFSDFTINEIKEFNIDLKLDGKLDDKLANTIDDQLDDKVVNTYIDYSVIFKTNNRYDIPELMPDMIYNDDVDDIYFGKDDVIEDNKTYLTIYNDHNYWNVCQNQITCFYEEDALFESIYTKTENFIKKIENKKPKAFCSPDFSVWGSDPFAIALYATYKKFWCSRFLQELGYKILPSISFNYYNKDWDFLKIGYCDNISQIICEIQSGDMPDLQIFKQLLDYQKIINFKKVYIYGKENKNLLKLLNDSGIECKFIPTWLTKKLNR